MIEFWQDWSGVFSPRSHLWVDFTIAHLSVEKDGRFGNFEWHIGLLGFHVRGTHKVGEGDAKIQADLAQFMNDLDSGSLRVSIPIAEYEELKNPEPVHVACQSGAVIREDAK